jgi:RecB family endonuclease NucS
VQNWFDGTRRTFGKRGKLSISWNADTKLYEINMRKPRGNVVVATIDNTKRDELRIVQQEIALEECNLKIDSTKTDDDSGGHG